jgi:hypothetical protein
MSAVPDVLKTVRLRKTFEAEGAPVRALRGIDLVLSAGEFVASGGGPHTCARNARRPFFLRFCGVVSDEEEEVSRDSVPR